MVIKEGAEVATAAVNAMSGSPLAIALLVVNLGFLAFASYVLGEVASNAAERNKTQMELIISMVKEIEGCYDRMTAPHPQKG